METEHPQPARHMNKILIGDLDAILAAITALEPDGTATVSAAHAIKTQLKGAIKTALKRKITYTQLVALLKEKGIELREETLKGYVRAAKKPKKRCAPGIETTKAPQKPEPAAKSTETHAVPTPANPTNASRPDGVMAPATPVPHPSVPQAGGV